jgi:hypothetical protein
MQTWFYVIAITITSVTLFAIVFWSSKRKENFEVVANANVTFLSREEVRDFIQRDEDGYIASLTPLDLLAREVSSISEYIKRIAPAEISEDHKKNINKLAYMVDTYLMKSGQHKLASVPWKIAVTSNATYENGYPHTRKDIIFLSTNEMDSIDLGQTLLHEKVHVYQRMYPAETYQYLRDIGYERWKLRRDEPLARSNPDLDDWIYIDPNTKKPMVAYYSSSKPSSISDVTLDHPSYEHPFEKMAYDIASKLN